MPKKYKKRHINHDRWFQQDGTAHIHLAITKFDLETTYTSGHLILLISLIQIEPMSYRSESFRFIFWGMLCIVFRIRSVTIDNLKDTIQEII